jgi:chorismate synthase
MIRAIDQARVEGDSVGGVFVVYAMGLPVGLGSHVHWDRRLDGLLAQAVMSIPAIKGVEIGMGFKAAEAGGSSVHDPIGFVEGKGYVRPTNNAGGLEGGITNGQPLLIRVAMKPIPTLYHPLETVNLITHQVVKADVERSDVCAVPAASVVAEAMVAWVLAEALIEKFGGDTLEDMMKAYESYQKRLEQSYGHSSQSGSNR